jgi:Ca2+-dependent lipid-binding protein
MMQLPKYWNQLSIQWNSHHQFTTRPQFNDSLFHVGIKLQFNITIPQLMEIIHKMLEPNFNSMKQSPNCCKNVRNIPQTQMK